MILLKFNCIKISKYFPKPYKPLGRNINVKVDLSSYATKADIKNISDVETSNFASKTNLANLKTEFDKLDIDKLTPVPVDLSKLSDVVKNDIVKKDVYNKLVAKVDNINTSGFVLKTKYDTDKSELENKIPDTSGLVKKTDYNTKLADIEGKIPDVSNLATKTALTTVENKIPNVRGLASKDALTTVENKIPDVSKYATKNALTNLSNTVPDISTLIKKSDYDTKIAEIENKYVSNSGVTAKLAQANVITKRNFDAKIIELENKTKKLQTFDSSYFRGKNYFEEDGTQNYLVFHPIIKYFKIIANTKHIASWQSKRSSRETIKPYSTSDNSLTPLIDYYDSKVRVKFNKSCLKQ